MEYRRLGSSGLRVSELCLGTMTFGHGLMGIGVLGQEEAAPLVRAALDAGVNLKAADLELTPDELEKLAAPTAPHLPYPQWMIAWQSGRQRPPVR